MFSFSICYCLTRFSIVPFFQVTLATNSPNSIWMSQKVNMLVWEEKQVNENPLKKRKSIYTITILKKRKKKNSNSKTFCKQKSENASKCKPPDYFLKRLFELFLVKKNQIKSNSWRPFLSTFFTHFEGTFSRSRATLPKIRRKKEDTQDPNKQSFLNALTQTKRKTKLFAS